jgi:hypothetical protein
VGSPQLCKLQKGRTRFAAGSDKVYQLLSRGRWFSPGIPASSTTKTGRHDIAEILLKVVLNTINQSINLLVKPSIPNFNIVHSKQSKHLLILHQYNDLKMEKYTIIAFMRS